MDKFYQELIDMLMKCRNLNGSGSGRKSKAAAQAQEENKVQLIQSLIFSQSLSLY
jgi:hypothetical protein